MVVLRPLVVVLWVTGAETVDLSSLPWAPLCGAAALSLGQFPSESESEPLKYIKYFAGEPLNIDY